MGLSGTRASGAWCPDPPAAALPVMVQRLLICGALGALVLLSQPLCLPPYEQSRPGRPGGRAHLSLSQSYLRHRDGSSAVDQFQRQSRPLASPPGSVRKLSPASIPCALNCTFTRPWDCYFPLLTKLISSPSRTSLTLPGCFAPHHRHEPPGGGGFSSQAPWWP